MFDSQTRKVTRPTLAELQSRVSIWNLSLNEWTHRLCYIHWLFPFFQPSTGFTGGGLFCRVIECRTMKFDTDSKKPKRIKCNHFLWSFNFSSFTIRWDRRFPQYLLNHQMPETLDTGSFTGISGVWALPFKAADIWAGNLGNYVFQGGMKVFPGQTFFTSFELMQSANSYPDTLRKHWNYAQFRSN